ncbi:hypothetical protein TST_1316 [Thermosulfidibacter takaii ABI70S6]|uniref:HTH merR-type domain-containing protein n=1 Tax=Thermosulfidibacter takaii (strain DSM 17441 / JCM 13301 / NBRC 103674 / ABI70S6) TaxID=1298851 RepID=A0A0S3QUV9_THET7|nr:NifB/NifX family molybdenum-iron cluster-binding protein [Thermosulfidibacter takaii]BAT72103.1 hypothetical protein TST_1316 [Thermosulfidibacter takaii ABI70S6]
MKKPMYPIGIVSRLLNVHPRMLRIYEKEGLVKPTRIGGKRYYSESDLQKLRCIRILLEEGVNIAGVKKLFSVAPCWRVINCPENKKKDCAYYKEFGRWKMRIVFAVENNDGLNSIVSTHFRRSPYFVVVDLDEDGEIVNYEIKENPYLNIHGPGIVPGFIKELGADAIVTGGMGQRAAMFFEAEGIEPIVGASGTVSEVLQKILKGERFEGSLCEHHEHKGQCHRGG